jgi:hypothetical protein
MRLLFSESKADYGHYIFPYAIWAFPEPGESPSALFELGFLPSSRNLDRFYLCRQVRINLRKYRPSSENRRVLRKGQDIDVSLVPRDEFDYTPQKREFYKTYTDIRFGKDVMTAERLDLLFSGKITSHLLVFTEKRSGREVGTATLYLEGDELAYYELKFLIHRDQTEQKHHLLESEEYREQFYKDELQDVAGSSMFKVEIK